MADGVCVCVWVCFCLCSFLRLCQQERDSLSMSVCVCKYANMCVCVRECVSVCVRECVCEGWLGVWRLKGPITSILSSPIPSLPPTIHPSISVFPLLLPSFCEERSSSDPGEFTSPPSPTVRSPVGFAYLYLSYVFVCVLFFLFLVLLLLPSSP